MPWLVASDGVRLHYSDAGKGPPIVFLHGWMMSHRFFHHQLSSLSGSRRCIGLDLRGCGQSEARKGTHTMERFAADLHELLAHLGLHGVTVVGWSLGGGITMRYLDLYGPERLRAVGLIDFPPKFAEDPAVPDKVCKKLETDRAAYSVRFLKSMFLHEPAPADLAWMLAEYARCPSDIGCEMYRQLGRGEAKGSFDLPALLVFPTNGWFPKAVADWKRVFPDSRAPTFEASRHCPFLEEHEKFTQELAAFTG